MSRELTSAEFEEYMSEYEYIESAPEAADDVPWLEDYPEYAQESSEGYTINMPEIDWTAMPEPPDPELIEDENIPRMTDEAPITEETDRSPIRALRDRASARGFEIYDDELNDSRYFIVILPNGYEVEITESSIEETGNADLITDESDVPGSVPVYQIFATDNLGNDLYLTTDEQPYIYCTETVLENTIIDSVAQLQPVPEEIPEVEQDIDDRNSAEDILREHDNSDRSSSDPFISETEENDAPAPEEEYHFHPDAGAEQDIPNPSEQALHEALNRALYNAIGKAERTDIEDIKAGEETRDNATALAESIYQSIRADRELREKANEYAKEQGWVRDGKSVTNVRLVYHDNRSDDSSPVNEVAFRLIIEPDNNRDRTPENRESRFINILSESETSYWTHAINLSADVIMRGESHVDRLMKEENSLFRDIDAAEKEQRESGPRGEDPTFEHQETREEDREAEDAYWDSRANEYGGNGRPEYVTFNVWDHNGERQNVRAAVNREEKTIGLIVQPKKDDPINYELTFKGAPKPIFSTEKLFTPHESMYLSEAVKETIAKYVATSTAKTVNNYYSSPAENKHGSFDVVATAMQWKERYIDKIMSLEDGKCSKDAYGLSAAGNTIDAENLFRIMGLRFNTYEWKPSLSTVERSDGSERVPVLHLENVGARGADKIKAAAAGLGVEASYDRATGTVSLWMHDEAKAPIKPGYWQNEYEPTNEEFNRILLRLAEARTIADKNGRSLDARKGVIVPEQDVWEHVRNMVKPERGIDDDQSYSRESQKMASIYLKSMGLNMGRRGVFDWERYPMRHLNGHKMQLYEVPLMKDAGKTAFVVRMGQVTEGQFAHAESYLKTLGLHYTYDKDDHIFTVAYSPEGRPAFERLDAYRQPDYSKVTESYKEAAANTIGKMEGRHLITSNLYRSSVLRQAILRGYSESAEKDMEREGKDPDLSEDEARHMRSNGQLYFYTMPMEQAITRHRDETLEKWEQTAHLSQHAQDQIGRVAGSFVK